MSKDLKLILFFLCIETVMLSLLLVGAVKKYLPRGASGAETVSSLSDYGPKKYHADISAQTLNNVELIQRKDDKTPSPDGSTTPVPEPTEEPVLYNYYRFNFTENGYSSEKLTDEQVKNGVPGATFSGVSADYVKIPTSTSTYKIGVLTVQNDYIKHDIPFSDIMAEPLKLRRMGGDDSNRVILYYTHTYEAYCANEEEQTYTRRWYTSDDPALNVIAPGTVFLNKLSEYGIKGFNETKTHEQELSPSASYVKSRVTLTEALEKNPDASLVIDIHRNGYGKLKNGRLYGPTAEADGVKYARIMFVIGLDYNESTGSFDTETNPYWRENIKLAAILIEKMEERVPGVTFGITLRKTPYNQNLAPNSLLIEIGFEGNLASEAEATGELMAEIVAEIYS